MYLLGIMKIQIMFLKNLSIEFKKGDVIGITGPTGCGKSTY